MSAPTTLRTLALASTVAVSLLGTPTPAPTAAALPAGDLACTARIRYTPQSGTPETYAKSFVLTPGTTYVDDFSTPTKQHVFTVSAVQLAGEARVSFDYFSDVSVFNAIELDTDVTLSNTQKKEEAHGVHRFFSSQAGTYKVEYDLTVRRL
ncbi:MAG: hypothetical protein R3F34_16060 [Planctomycetota bacterium]